MPSTCRSTGVWKATSLTCARIQVRPASTNSACILLLNDGPTVSYLCLHHFSSGYQVIVVACCALSADCNIVVPWHCKGNFDRHCTAGGVFEEAIAIANLLLPSGQEIAQTVRTATFVDNTWKVTARLTCLTPVLFGWVCLQMHQGTCISVRKTILLFCSAFISAQAKCDVPCCIKCAMEVLVCMQLTRHNSLVISISRVRVLLSLPLLTWLFVLILLWLLWSKQQWTCRLVPCHERCSPRSRANSPRSQSYCWPIAARPVPVRF